MIVGQATEFPPFDASTYQLSFPLLEAKNGEMYLTLLGRDDVVKTINNVIMYVTSNVAIQTPKYSPIIISTSRGMGKTFLLKMIGMQKVKEDLKCLKIEQAGSCGRILSFDFIKHEYDIQNAKDAASFFTRLMIHYLCRLFEDTQVGGINFYFIAFGNVRSKHADQEFNAWKSKCLDYGADKMMDEYIRLTNIAFFGQQQDKYCIAPPVFLLDEVQVLCRDAEFESTMPSKKHTILSLLLTQLAGTHWPVCICTGTNNGNILSITEMSCIIPRIISLTPFIQESDYLQYWTELTNYYNKNQPASARPIYITGDEELINALVYASYQIPRLLNIAHRTWYNFRNSVLTNREFCIQLFEEEATKYYGEMCSFLKDYSVPDVSQIFMSCGVHWRVKNVDVETVPGTKIQWSELIQKSVVFPYLDNCFLIPFMLVWRQNSNAFDDMSRIKESIREHCSQEVKNLQLKDLFVSYDELCQCDIYQFGIRYETLFASSLAVKYHVWKLANKEQSNMVPFCAIYDVGGVESEQSMHLLLDLKTDLSQGIYYPNIELSIDQDLPHAVIHNKNIHNAHHDIILPTNQGVIPISVKASFRLAGESVINRQLYFNKFAQLANKLIWLYLGSQDTELKYENVAFINGSGVCNGLAIDMFILVKKLKSLNNRQ
jgi:hypothetical protein